MEEVDMSQVRRSNARPAFGVDSVHLTDPDRDADRPRTLKDHFEQSVESCVYFVEADNAVRIGTVTQRAVHTSVQVPVPPGGRLVAVIEHAGDVAKRQIHEMFRASHLNREWFERTPELDALIAAHAVDN